MSDKRALATVMILGLALAGCASEPTVETAATEQGVDEAAGSTCSAGTPLCCNDLGAGNDPTIALLLGLLGIVAQNPSQLVGVTCRPLDSSCTAQPVCCTNNNFNGLVALGYSPIQQ